MDCLYHYCSNNTCFSILNSQTFRLSDIQKSNDYRELSLFFPGILYVMEQQYAHSPFPFRYKEFYDAEALSRIIRESFIYWQGRFIDGDFSNLVFCFSEEPDVLSQWRGYADDGRGCCIGFSKELLDAYCKSHKNVLRLEKVEYVTDDLLNNYTNIAAQVCLNNLKTLRTHIVDNMTHDENSAETDKRLHYNFDMNLETVFIDSLRFKSVSFQEEKEWRIFFKNPAYK